MLSADKISDISITLNSECRLLPYDPARQAHCKNIETVTELHFSIIQL